MFRQVAGRYAGWILWITGNMEDKSEARESNIFPRAEADVNRAQV